MEQRPILEKHELIDSWPGTQNAYKCVVLDYDNTKLEERIPKAECELLMYLSSIHHKLTQPEFKNLKKLIEAFGDERYDEAMWDQSMDDEGI